MPFVTEYEDLHRACKPWYGTAEIQSDCPSPNCTRVTIGYNDLELDASMGGVGELLDIAPLPSSCERLYRLRDRLRAARQSLRGDYHWMSHEAILNDDTVRGWHRWMGLLIDHWDFLRTEEQGPSGVKFQSDPRKMEIVSDEEYPSSAKMCVSHIDFENPMARDILALTVVPEVRWGTLVRLRVAWWALRDHICWDGDLIEVRGDAVRGIYAWLDALVKEWDE